MPWHPLITERLVLREFMENDLDDLYELDQDEAVRRYLDMPKAPTLAQSREVLDRFLGWHARSDRHGYFVAERAGEFLGWFHLRPSRETGETEIGYRLKASAWGQGYATEGSRALLQRALVDHGDPVVIALALAENVASWRVMEKLGMVRRREFLYDHRLPAVEYAITAE